MKPIAFHTVGKITFYEIDASFLKAGDEFVHPAFDVHEHNVVWLADITFDANHVFLNYGETNRGAVHVLTLPRGATVKKVTG